MYDNKYLNLNSIWTLNLQKFNTNVSGKFYLNPYLKTSSSICQTIEKRLYRSTNVCKTFVQEQLGGWQQHYEAKDEYCLRQTRLSTLYPRQKYTFIIYVPTDVFLYVIQIKILV